MQLSRFGLGVVCAFTASALTIVAPSAVFAEEKPAASADKSAQTSINAISGEIKVIDEASQVIEIAEHRTKFVPKADDKTVGVIRKETNVMRVITITPQTQFTKQERNLFAAKMKVGDIISSLGVSVNIGGKWMNYRMFFDTIELSPTVASVNPLTFRMKNIVSDGFLGGSDAVTITHQDGSSIVTVTKPDRIRFGRSTQFNFSDLAVGQPVQVYPIAQASSKANEKIEAARIVVNE